MSVRVQVRKGVQLEQLVQRLETKLSPRVCEELNTYTVRLSEEKFMGIHDRLNQRFERMNEELLTWTKLEESGQEISIQEAQRRFFEIANPKEMYQDLESVFHFSDISRQYEYFLSGMKHNPYGSLLSMLSLKEASFQYLNSEIMKEAQPAFDALSLYSSLVGKHFDLVAEVKSSRGFKFFVKLILKSFGLATLGPMGSIGAGIFVNALFDQSSALGQSMAEVAAQYDQYEVELNESLVNMERAYQYVLMGLFGGALIKANEALENQNLAIHSLNMEKYEFQVVYIGKEEVNVRLWAERQIHIIKRRMEEGKWPEVHALTDRLYHFVKSKPGMEPVLLKNGRSLRRESFLLKYLVVSKMADTLKMQGDPNWAGFVGNMLKQLPFTVRSEEASEYGVRIPAEWGMLLVHQALVEKTPALAASYLDYTYLIVRRMLNEWNVLEDEQLAENEVDWNMAFGYAVSLFAEDKLKMQHPMQTYNDEFFHNRLLIKELRKRYLKVAEKDSMSRFLWLLLQIEHAALIIRPIYKGIKWVGSVGRSIVLSSGKWLGKNGHRMLRTSGALAAIFLLLYGGYQYKDEIKGKFIEFAEGMAAESEQEGQEPAEEAIYEVENFEETEDPVVDDSTQGDSVPEESQVEQEEPVEMLDSAEQEASLDMYSEESSMETVSDAVSTEELAAAEARMAESEADIEVYRLDFEPFQVAGRAFTANLDEQTTPATDPFSLSITEERPDSVYVQSHEVLENKPDNIWVTNFAEGSKQMIAIGYPDSQNIDFFIVNEEGYIEERNQVLANDFAASADGFTFIDIQTRIMKKVIIDGGITVEEM